MKTLLPTALGLGLVLASTSPAFAKKDEQPGVELVVQVLDSESMEPIKTAKVRNPQEKEPHAVNGDTGEWRGRVLYLPDGTEVFFEKKMVLTFEVSAPNYKLSKVTYTMKPRKNKILVPLEKMTISLDDVEEDDPVIQFGRDKPIGGRPIE